MQRRRNEADTSICAREKTTRTQREGRKENRRNRVKCELIVLPFHEEKRKNHNKNEITVDLSTFFFAGKSELLSSEKWKKRAAKNHREIE